MGETVQYRQHKSVVDSDAGTHFCRYGIFPAMIYLPDLVYLLGIMYLLAVIYLPALAAE